MKSRDADILIIPGLGGSGPDHWQTRWQAKLPTARRVDQTDWDHPVRASWMGQIAEAIASAERPVVIVAHSLGVTAAAQVLSATDRGRIAGAFLVAPPEENALRSLTQIDPTFVPYPAQLLPCPSIVVGSTDDPYASSESTARLADQWGSKLLDAGAAGHINSESGHGPWPEGLMAFAGFISRL